MGTNNFYPAIGVSPITGFSPLQEHLLLKTCSLRVAQDYFNWFLDYKLIRVNVLKGEVKQWNADYSLQSLILLEEYLMLKLGKKSNFFKKAQHSLYAVLTGNFEIKALQLSEIELSILYDVGLYFGDMLCYNNKELNWNMFINNNHIQNNIPIISRQIGDYYVNYHHLTNMLSWYNTRKVFDDYTLVTYYCELIEIFKNGYIDNTE
jgi:hypothetical protein